MSVRIKSDLQLPPTECDAVCRYRGQKKKKNNNNNNNNNNKHDWQRQSTASVPRYLTSQPPLRVVNTPLVLATVPVAYGTADTRDGQTERATSYTTQ